MGREVKHSSVVLNKLVRVKFAPGKGNEADVCAAISKGKTPVPVCSPTLSPVGRVDIWMHMGYHLDKIACAVLLRKAGVVDINHAFHLHYNIVCGLSFSQSQPDFEGFLRALRFPPSSKLTP